MIKLMAEKLSLCFVRQKIIKEEDKNIYYYGCELLIASVLCKLIGFIIGLALGLLAETILFLTVFFLIRLYAGGYHASTHLNCITLFNFVFLTLMLITNFLVQHEYYQFTYIGMVISGGLIFKYAPVEDKNKPLNEVEREKYRKNARSRTLIIILGTLLLSILFSQWAHFLSYSAMAVCEAGVVVKIGKMKNKANNSLDCKKLLQKKLIDI